MFTDTRMFYDYIQNIQNNSFPLFNKFCLRYINEINSLKTKRREKRSKSSGSNSSDSSRLTKVEEDDKKDKKEKEYKETFSIEPFFLKEEESKIINNLGDYINSKYSTSSKIV